MSDFSQGPGWWQASDGKWYPPDQTPGSAPASGQAGFSTSPTYGNTPFGDPGFSPPGGYPMGGATPGPLASWGDRVVAAIIDWAILVVGYIVVFILAMVLGAIADALGALVFLVGYIGLFALGIYIYFLQGEVGGTPGKRLTGLKVVREQDGQLLGGGMSIVRQLAKIIDGLPCYIGYLFPLWDEKKQTLSDKVMKTVVLRDQPKMEFGPDLFKK